MTYPLSYTSASERPLAAERRLPFLLVLLIFSLAIEPSSLLTFRVSNYAITIFEILLVACAMTTVFEMRHKRLLGSSQPVLVLMILSAFLSLVGVLLGNQEMLSYDFKIILNFVEHTILLFLLIAQLRSIERIYQAMNVFLLTGFGAAAITILQALGWVDLGFETTFRQGGSATGLDAFLIGTRGLDNAVMIYGELFIAALPIVIIKQKFRGQGLFRIIALVVLVLASILMYSRSVWLAMVGQLLLAVIIFPRLTTYRPKPLTLFFTAITAMFTVIYWGPSFFSWLVGLRAHSVEGRVIVYVFGFTTMSQSIGSMLFGIGKGGIYQATLSVTHNLFLDVLFSRGILVFLLVSAIFVRIFRDLVRSFRLGVASGSSEIRLLGGGLLLMLAGLLLHSMGAPTLNSKPLWTSLGIMLAFTLVVHSTVSPSSFPRVEPPARKRVWVRE